MDMNLPEEEICMICIFGTNHGVFGSRTTFSFLFAPRLTSERATADVNDGRLHVEWLIDMHEST